MIPDRSYEFPKVNKTPNKMVNLWINLKKHKPYKAI